MRFEKLGNIVTIQKGKKPKFSENPTENSFRVLQIDDLRNDNKIQYTDEKTGVLANEEDVLIAWDGANAGTIGYGKSGYVGSTIAVLRKKRPSEFSTTFLGKFLQSQSEFLKGKSTGATIPHIDRKSLDNLVIPLIPLEDQIRIATLLSKAEALIKQRKESIDLLDEYLKSTFLEMFGDESNSNYPIKTLNDVSIKITDGEHGTVERFEKGRLYLMARNITRSNELDFEQVSYISEDAHQKIFKRCNPQKDDLLLVCVGATIGKVALVPEMEEFSIARSVALIKPNHKLIDSRYLLCFFNTDFGIRQIKSGSNEAAQAGLYTGNLKKIKIPLPPIEIQNHFASIVEKTEQINSQYKSSLAELENLYDSLSQKAFKGELNLEKGEELLMAAEPVVGYGKIL